MSRAASIDTGAVPAPPAKAGGRSAAGRSSARPGYFEHSRTPLVSLVFVLPLVVIYELGTAASGPAEAARGTPQHIVAFTLLQQFFSLFGATGRHLPALAIVGILIAWHVARRDPWKVRWTALGGIAAESLLLSVPLLAIGVLLAHLFQALPLAAAPPAHGPVSALPSRDLLVLCLGAGIYEELVFRLIVLTVLSLVVKDLLLFPARTSGLTVVVLSGILFSAYHYLGHESFNIHSAAAWRTFAFRTVAGIYFGVLFLTRGFGVTAATHAAYDILVVLALP
jgi:membrane protease YdiL (CAAX protease family)